MNILIKKQDYSNILFIFIKRHPDSNWGVMNLQSTALPLGYTAIILIFKNELNIY